METQGCHGSQNSEEVTNHRRELMRAKFKNKMNNVGVELTLNSTCELTSKMQTKKPWQPN